MENIKATTFNKLWFISCLVLLFIQFARPQSIVPQLEILRPYLLSSFIVIMFLIVSKENMLQLAHMQMRLMWVIVIFFILTLPFALNSGFAFNTIRTLLIYFPFIISILILVDNEKKLKIFVMAFTVIGLFNTIHGLWTHDGAYRYAMFNIGHFLKDPNEFSLYMNMMIPFAYFLFLHEAKWNIWKGLWLFTTILMVTTIIVSFSRGGLVGLVCVSAVMWMFSPHKKVTFILGILGLVCVLALSPSAWKEIMSTTTDSSSSTAQTRIIAWKGSINLFIDYPIVGVGAGNVPVKLNDYVPYHGTNHWYGGANHSVWLTALAEGGIVGMFLYLLLIYINFKDCFHMRKTSNGFMLYFSVACIGSLIGFFSSGTFLTVNYYPHFWYLTAIIAAGSRIAYERRALQ